MTRHFGEVVGEPPKQDSFVTVKTDSHVANADEHVPKPGRTNPGCNTLPPIGTSGPSGHPGPCWHPDKTKEEGGNTATTRASPRESGPWSLRSATGLTSRRHELQVVWICQRDPERQISPTPQRSHFIKLGTVTSERAALGCRPRVRAGDRATRLCLCCPAVSHTFSP